MLKFHFHIDGKEYDVTYRSQSDPDNYPRFTSYVIFPPPNRPDSKRFFQSTNEANAVGMREPILDLATKFSM